MIRYFCFFLLILSIDSYSPLHFKKTWVLLYVGIHNKNFRDSFFITAPISVAIK